ncbi:MAG: HEAT repeat domain-containing protein, partial [Desulfovibrionaceae bacterium]|nr:HEAT repeat domain-containing protein [Desulfovibrionaceae bacterium]
MPDVKEILEGLRSDDNEVLREAAFQAGELDLKDAVPLLVGLLETSNIGVQEAADNALRRIAGPEAVQSVIPLLRSENAPSRNMAMDILRVIGCDDLHAVFGLMRDEDPDIRIFAADILGTTANSLAVNPLCNALLKDPEVNVRYQAAVSLGVLAMPEAAKCLNLAMGDEEWVQYAVIEALAKIKHSSSVDALVKGMDRSSDLVASMIIDALAEIGNVKAVAMLMRRIPDSPTALANKIVKAVVGILGGKALTMLSDHDRETLRLAMLKAVEDEDEEVQDAAIQGLAYLGGERASKAIIGIAAGIDRDLNQERLDEIVGHLANIGLTEAIRSDLDSADAARAEVAVEAMGRMTDPAVPRLLMDAFWDKDLNLQRRMAWVLSKLAGPEAVDFFLDLFARHTDGKVLKSAVKYCSEHK